MTKRVSCGSLGFRSFFKALHLDSKRQMSSAALGLIVLSLPVKSELGDCKSRVAQID
jgi:hypothetical protein